jgi:tetratricopeptide (TPR) repeat protein
MFRFKKYVLVYLCFLSALHAQSRSELLLERAEFLFNSNQYFDAITEYKRTLFFAEENDVSAKVNFRIAQCYKAGAFFNEAINYFGLAERNSSDSSFLFDIKTKVIRCNILRRTIARAIQICDDLEHDSRFVSRFEEINYWRGWAYMFADDWRNASKSFGKYDSQKELKLLCDQVQNDKLSVTFAKVISYILPGSGQIYSGKILSGLLSLTWNLAAGYFTVNAFISNRAFDGIVIGELVWLRFYRGNVENAENFAEQKNIEVANKALEYLQNEYRGLKP